MNESQGYKPFRLACLLYVEHGEEKFAFAPLCSKCERPILNFGLGNVEVLVDLEASRTLIPIDGEDGRRYLREPGDAYAFHLDCCPEVTLGAWKRLNTVMRADQRYEWEIPNSATNGGPRCGQKKR